MIEHHARQFQVKKDGDEPFISCKPTIYAARVFDLSTEAYGVQFTDAPDAERAAADLVDRLGTWLLRAVVDHDGDGTPIVAVQHYSARNVERRLLEVLKADRRPSDPVEPAPEIAGARTPNP